MLATAQNGNTPISWQKAVRTMDLGAQLRPSHSRLLLDTVQYYPPPHARHSRLTHDVYHLLAVSSLTTLTLWVVYQFYLFSTGQFLAYYSTIGTLLRTDETSSIRVGFDSEHMGATFEPNTSSLDLLDIPASLVLLLCFVDGYGDSQMDHFNWNSRQWMNLLRLLSTLKPLS